MSIPKTMRKRSAFSLIELVIVVVIIGIIAAIAIPRMSRGAAGANDSNLTGNLAILRKAIDLYAAEHGGTFPDGTSGATFTTALTAKTNADGTTTGTPIYGPYIRSIPNCPVGSYKGSNVVLTSGTAGAAAGGWLYTGGTTGTIVANCKDTDADASGNKYNLY